MATSITAGELRALPLSNYALLRPQLRSGDLFFASGEYRISQIIRQVTRSPWSHVGLVFILPAIDRVLLLESVEDVGVRLAPLSKYLADYEDGKPYEGRCVLARHEASPAPGFVQALAAFGCDQLTRSYAKQEYFDIMARIVTGTGTPSGHGGFICSELVAGCFRHAGIEIPAGRHGFVSPEDCWRARGVEYFARIL